MNKIKQHLSSLAIIAMTVLVTACGSTETGSNTKTYTVDNAAGTASASLTATKSLTDYTDLYNDTNNTDALLYLTDNATKAVELTSITATTSSANATYSTLTLLGFSDESSLNSNVDIVATLILDTVKTYYLLTDEFNTLVTVYDSSASFEYSDTIIGTIEVNAK